MNKFVKKEYQKPKAIELNAFLTKGGTMGILEANNNGMNGTMNLSRKKFGTS